MPDTFRTLPGLLDALWLRLVPGTPVALATRQGEGAAVRTVIVRGADRNTGSLRIHTHSRSKKVSDLASCPHAELLLWDPDADFQARLTTVFDVAPADPATWANQSDGQRLNYARDPMPGTPLDNPDTHPTPEPALMTILTARIEALDLLCLGTTPHARARFSRQDDFKGQWIAP